MSYYFSTDGEQVEGPVSVEELRALIRAGRIGRETQVCAESSETWQPLAVALPQLFTKGTPPPPPGRRSGDTGVASGGLSASSEAVTRAEIHAPVAGAEITRPDVNQSASYPPAAILGSGGTFAGYALLRPLRVVSGEAELWEAERQGERRVLKIYHRGLRPKPEVVELMWSLEPEHVVRVYETGEVGGRFYEVQEFIEHGSLADLTKLGGVAEGKAREILRELAAALEHLHGRKPAILHRDIKPSNVLVRSLEPLNLVLTDFGIASAAELSLHRTTVSRTAGYAAPEALQGTVSKASDWWAVGVMLVELLTGRHPYAGLDEHAINYQIVTRGVAIPPDVPERWRAVLQGLLTRDQANRWGSSEVQRWLAGNTNVPVAIETPAGVAATHRPYKFGGKEYYEAAALAEALAQQWDEAVKHLGRGYIAKWVEEELRDASLASSLADVAEDQELDAEPRLAVSLLAIAPQLPLTWRGTVVTPEWVQAEAAQGKRLLESSVPEWLERLRSERWLSELKRRWQAEREALGQLMDPAKDFDEEFGETLLLRDDGVVLAEASRQRAAYVGSKNATIDSLLKAPAWNKLEAVAFLTCRRELLRTFEQARENPQAPCPEPDDTTSHRELGDPLMAKGGLDGAAGDLAKPRASKPDAAIAHNNLGHTLYDKGDLDGAIREYREALRVNPDFAIARNNLGVALQDKGNLDEAIREYREALRLQPDLAIARKNLAIAHNNLGMALRGKRDLDRAIQELREALRFNPGLAIARVNLINALITAKYKYGVLICWICLGGLAGIFFASRC